MNSKIAETSLELAKTARASLVFGVVFELAGAVLEDVGVDDDPEPELPEEVEEGALVLAPEGRLAPFCKGEGGEVAEAPTPCRPPGV